MLEKRSKTSDIKSTDDRTVLPYGDLDRPLDENPGSNNSSLTTRTLSNSIRYFENLFPKPAVNGRFKI